MDMGDMRYTGTVLFGRRNGFGLGIYYDGSKYQGMWVNDLKDGSGKFEDPMGGFSEGMWNRGNRRG